ncbi:MAG: hypothetical protein GEU88_03845 [Solirubrobacterales bacterium]|nr:hypothetical protein [Solirubrobacterales bacterium]
MWADWTADVDRFEMTVAEVTEPGEQMTVAEVTEPGERVLVEVLPRGMGKSSGAEVEGRFWLLYTFDGGKVVRLEAFASERQALEAVG